MKEFIYSSSLAANEEKLLPIMYYGHCKPHKLSFPVFSGSLSLVSNMFTEVCGINHGALQMLSNNSNIVYCSRNSNFIEVTNSATNTSIGLEFSPDNVTCFLTTKETTVLQSKLTYVHSKTEHKLTYLQNVFLDYENDLVDFPVVNITLDFTRNLYKKNGAAKFTHITTHRIEEFAKYVNRTALACSQNIVK